MKAKKLKRFWPALEELTARATVPAGWRLRLGAEYELVGPLVRSTGEAASTYPDTRPGREGLELRLVEEGTNRHVAVDEEGTVIATLSTDDIIVREVHRNTLLTSLAAVFGLEPGGSPVDGSPGTFRVGVLRPMAGYSFPAFLAIQRTPEDLQAVVAYLTARETEPFILLAPTRRFCELATESLLRQHKICFMTLDDTVAISGEGKLVLIAGTDTPLQDFKKAMLPGAEAESGMVHFPTPAGARWRNVEIRFTDPQAASVRVGDVHRVLTYTQMGMANKKNGKPTVQWELLWSFAQGNGLLDWSHSDADRKNQKRKEKLAGDLQAFFRIDGDPFQRAGNGWQAVFSVLPDS